MPEDPSVQQVGAGHVPRVVDLLVEALADDPFYRWAWSTDPDGPLEGLRAWVGLAVERTADRSTIHVVQGPAGLAAGAAVWLDPERPLEAADYAAAGQLAADRLGARAGLLMAAIAAPAAHIPPAPHRTLLFAGVIPGAQGLGLGRRLVEPGLEAADRAGTPVQVSSTNPRNLSFYARLGFVPLADPVVTGDAPPIIPMWRSTPEDRPATDRALRGAPAPDATPAATDQPHPAATAPDGPPGR